ncbi:MAG: methylenetetrahydrofolate reductase C-terminal domain-containing protein [Solirubrobacterales bacterium]
MIVGNLKPLDEMKANLPEGAKVLVLGCGGCVTVCQTGGARAAEELAAALRLAGRQAEPLSLPRQCEWEFLDELIPVLPGFDLVLTLACGIGVQAMNARHPAWITLPALNTSFLGMPVRHGVFEERCQACGSCQLARTGGICPVARCSKSLSNGPCGGSQNGVCEISKTVSCAWQLIYDRLKALNRLEDMVAYTPPRNWSTSRDGGPRTMSREELMLDGDE